MEELREAHEAAERALHAASSEGLALVRANNASGFKGVMRDARKLESRSKRGLIVAGSWNASAALAPQKRRRCTRENHTSSRS